MFHQNYSKFLPLLLNGTLCDQVNNRPVMAPGNPPTDVVGPPVRPAAAPCLLILLLCLLQFLWLHKKCA